MARKVESDALIEQCAKIADDAAGYLNTVIATGSARRSQYDRQTRIRIKYAVRWCREIARRIRALDPAPEAKDHQNGDRLASAIMVLLELRPLIDAARDSQWKRSMLQRINHLAQ